MRYSKKIPIFVLCLLVCQFVSGKTPVVIWHGMGDTCCNPLSMGRIKALIEKTVPGVYVHSLMIGNNQIEDATNGFFMDTWQQIRYACHKISSDAKLKQGYHAIGFSQGGQFLRAVAQTCPTPRMKNLVSIGGQHQGVYGFPRCRGESSAFCNLIRKVLNYGVYTEFIQKHLVQAQYWHDPLNEAEYQEKSRFLAQLNSELKPNATYRANMLRLTNFTLVKFENDSMVDPRESEWFGFYAPGQAKKTYELRASKMYKQDNLGLKTLDQSGRLHFLSVQGDHLQVSDSWLRDNIIKRYFQK